MEGIPLSPPAHRRERARSGAGGRMSDGKKYKKIKRNRHFSRLYSKQSASRSGDRRCFRSGECEMEFEWLPIKIAIIMSVGLTTQKQRILDELISIRMAMILFYNVATIRRTLSKWP